MADKHEKVNDALAKCYLDIQYYLSSDESEEELTEKLNDNVKGLDSDEIEYINRDINRTINRRNRKYR